MNFNSDDLLELESYLKSNSISKKDICLVGSCSLSLFGIRTHNDIDIIIHSRADSQVISSHSFIEEVNKPWSKLFTDDEIIDNSNLHILYNDFKFVVLELVYHRKIWHNREKDKLDIIDLREYANITSCWNWDLIKDSLPNRNIMIKLYYKLYSIRHFINKVKSYLIQNNILHSHSFQVIKPALLLSKQHVVNTFSRDDIVIRYLAISDFIQHKEEGIDLYNKMQRIRNASKYKNPWRAFSELILSIKEDGYDLHNPILVNEDLHIINGAHRLACALYFGEPLISIKIHKGLLPAKFGMNWFEENGFLDNELSTISSLRKKIIIDYNLYFQVILWPPAAEFFDDIQSIISDRFTILKNNNYIDMQDFQDYVRKIYKIDDIKEWKVDMKLKAMSSYNNHFRVIDIYVPHPKFRLKSNNKLISKVMEELKKEIRSKYAASISGYLHDIIIHIGDNYSHTEKTKDLI